VLGLLLIAILTSTAFARESDAGFLHSIKSSITSVTGRIQDVAVAAVRPVRDGWNWFADLRTARDERDRLAEELRRAQAENVGVAVDGQRLADLEKLLRVRDERPSDYRAAAANIISRPLVDVAREARIDKGSADGVTVNSLVLQPMGDNVPDNCADPTRSDSDTCWFGALVGRVTHVDSHTSDIVFLTSPTTKIAARTLLGKTQLGLLTANALGDLIVTGVSPSATLSPQDPVVTMGVGTDRLMSPYPPGLPIGYVSSFGGADTGSAYTVQVTPYANPNETRTVMLYIPKTGIARRRAGIR
jgi:rod shape-determining protein MreC